MFINFLWVEWMLSTNIEIFYSAQVSSQTAPIIYSMESTC